MSATMAFDPARHQWAERESALPPGAGALKAPPPHQPLLGALPAAAAPAMPHSGISGTPSPCPAQSAMYSYSDYVAAPHTPMGSQGESPCLEPEVPGRTGLCGQHPAARPQHPEPWHQAHQAHAPPDYLSPPPAKNPGEQGFLSGTLAQSWPTDQQEQSGRALFLSQTQLQQHMPRVSPVTPHGSAHAPLSVGAAGYRFSIQHTASQHPPSGHGPPLTPAAAGERVGLGMREGAAASGLPHVRSHGSVGPTSTPPGRLSLSPTGAMVPASIGRLHTLDIRRPDLHPPGAGIGLHHEDGRGRPTGSGLESPYQERGIHSRVSAASDCLALLEDAQRQLQPFGRTARCAFGTHRKKQGLDRKDLPDDGYSWHKYGHKTLMGLFSRAYYRCTQRGSGCRAKKTVDTALKGSNEVRITYDGVHNHHAEKGAVEGIIVAHRSPEAATRPPGMPRIHMETGRAPAFNAVHKVQRERTASPSPPALHCRSKQRRVSAAFEDPLLPAGAEMRRSVFVDELDERRSPEQSHTALSGLHKGEPRGSGCEGPMERIPAPLHLPAEYRRSFGSQQRAVSVSPRSEDSTVQQAPTPPMPPRGQDEPSSHWRPHHSHPQHWGVTAPELPAAGPLAEPQRPEGLHVGATRSVDLELKL